MNCNKNHKFKLLHNLNNKLKLSIKMKLIELEKTLTKNMNNLKNLPLLKILINNSFPDLKL